MQVESHNATETLKRAQSTMKNLELKILGISNVHDMISLPLLDH
jgi:hypothetical protein